MRTSILVTLSAPALILSLTGCDRLQSWRGGDEAKVDSPANKPAVPGTRLDKPGAAPGPPVEEQGEVPLDDLTGIWRVTGVAPDGKSDFAVDDKRIVGSLMDVLPGQLRWSYTASKAFSSSDVCFGPVSGIIDDDEYAEGARKLIAPAVSRLRGQVLRLSKPHQWLCGDGGTWGEETEFQQLAPGRIAMRWRGDVTLIMERVRKVSRNPPPLPPTGAYEDP